MRKTTYNGKHFLYLILAFFCASFISGGKEYPQNYFSPPVDRQILLSGTFGELRPNHFHAGLDIKSRDGSIGEPILTAAPGFISRINVQSGGYGNVLYIDHPNGYTTVYAHLDRFIPEVAEYVRKMQYALKRFEVELYPSPDQFVFERHEQIGNLGNTGSSQGPHVHFEIRRTAGQVPYNPLLFGLPVRDDLPPSANDVRVYELNAELQTLDEHRFRPVSLGRGNYSIRDTLMIASEYVAFALKSFDQLNGASNLNGIYSLEMTLDGVTQYSFNLDAVPFSQTRYLNAHIDYAAKERGAGYYHRCFKLPGNALEIYTESNGRGVVQLRDTFSHQIILRAGDYAGNISTVTCYIKRSAAPPPAPDPLPAYRIDYLRAGHINTTGCTVGFEPHTFYENLDIVYQRDTTSRNGLFAPVHTLGSDDIPVHRYFDLSLLTSGLPERLKSKAFIAEISSSGRKINWGGTPIGDYIYASVRTLGKFSVAVDTIPPEIVPITFRSNMRGMSRMRFRIGDSQSVSGLAESLSFTATVDGEWILMEYEGKRAMLTHWFDDRIGPGEHKLILRVRDDRGNESVLERSFTR